MCSCNSELFFFFFFFYNKHLWEVKPAWEPGLLGYLNVREGVWHTDGSSQPSASGWSKDFWCHFLPAAEWIPSLLCMMSKFAIAVFKLCLHRHTIFWCPGSNHWIVRLWLGLACFSCIYKHHKKNKKPICVSFLANNMETACFQPTCPP